MPQSRERLEWDAQHQEREAACGRYSVAQGNFARSVVGVLRQWEPLRGRWADGWDGRN